MALNFCSCIMKILWLYGIFYQIILEAQTMLIPWRCFKSCMIIRWIFYITFINAFSGGVRNFNHYDKLINYAALWPALPINVAPGISFDVQIRSRIVHNLQRIMYRILRWSFLINIDEVCYFLFFKHEIINMNKIITSFNHVSIRTCDLWRK